MKKKNTQEKRASAHQHASTVPFPKGKVAVLVLLICIYVGAGVTLYKLFENEALPSLIEEPLMQVLPAHKQQAQQSLLAAQDFVNTRLVQNASHVNLYTALGENSSQTDNRTNSEAVSYRLYWLAKQGDKHAFDEQLSFIEEHMLQPEFGYLMWRLEEDDTVMGDGENIASDADLRAIKALLIAEERWKDPKYTQRINTIASGVKAVAVTTDGYLAPYGGVAGKNSTWTATEVYLSYADFPVIAELAKRRGQPWIDIYANMKQAYLDAQIEKGLFNSYLSPARRFGFGQDGEGYSINSMWMMVRAAESNDTELRMAANKSLSFYKERYAATEQLFPMYSSEGFAMSPYETPWAYALIARAAIALGDEEFADKMIVEMLQEQDLNVDSPSYGAFLEGEGINKRAGQFTLQESILTLQDYVQQPTIKKSGRAYVYEE